MANESNERTQELRTKNMIEFLKALTPSERMLMGDELVRKIARRLT